MKQSLKKFAAATFALSIVFTSGPVLDVLPASATAEQQILSELTELNDDTAPGIEMNENGVARSIDGQLSDTQVENDEDAKEVLRNISELLGVKDTEQELKFKGSSNSSYNTVYTFKQYYKDIELTNSYITIIVNNSTGRSEFLNSSFIPDFSMDVNPDVSASNAAQIVMEKYSVTLSEAPRLVIYSMDNTVHHLAWEVKTDSISPSKVYLDAKNGEILYAEMPSYANDEGDLAATYSLEKDSPLSGPFTVDIARDKDEENLYKLHDTERNIYVLDSTEFYCDQDYDILTKSYDFNAMSDKSLVISQENNQWDGYETELAVLYNVQKAYDFYDELMWTGTDDKNSDLFIIPQLRHENGAGVENAFSMRGTNTLAFGSGNGTDTRNWGLSLDVAVHEYTHRVTGNKVSWPTGYGEAASLNEAYSDIMAEYADGTDEWLHGTDHHLDGTSFGRDLTNPSINSFYYQKYTTPSHFQLVECHAGSTVISHAAYLMHKLGIPDHVTKKLWYISYDYMPHGSNATFADCRTAINKAADKVFDIYSYSKRLEWAYIIRKAFNTVNIRDKYDLVGDVNLDFKIDKNDITDLKDYLAPDKTFKFTQPVQEHYCDLTSDGVIDDADVAYLENKVSNKVIIKTQPTNLTVDMGDNVPISVTAIGEELTYQWYIKNPDDMDFRPVNQSDYFSKTYSATNPTLSYYVRPYSDKSELYCEITDRYNNKAVTDTITITVSNPFSITNDLPDNIAVRNYGNKVRLSITAEGNNLQYMWFERYPGSPVTASFADQENAHEVTLTEENEGMKVWCEITDQFKNKYYSNTTTIVAATSGDANSDGIINTDDLYFLHNILTGKVQVDDTVNVAFSDLNQNGKPDAEDLSLLLEHELIDKSQVAGDVNADGRINEDDLVALQDHLLGKATLETALQGYAADLCSDGTIDTFDMVQLRKKVLAILNQPQNTSAAIGSVITISVEVTSDEVSYQWYCRKPGQQDFEKTEITEDTFQITMTEELHGSEVYCMITDEYGNEITTQTVTLSATGSQNSTPSVSGDVNGDGILDISDAIFLARFVAEDSTLDMSNFNVQNADINDDGLTTAADTVYLIKKIAKLV